MVPYQPICHSINQLINQSVKQSINQSGLQSDVHIPPVGICEQDDPLMLLNHLKSLSESRWTKASAE